MSADNRGRWARVLKQSWPVLVVCASVAGVAYEFAPIRPAYYWLLGLLVVAIVTILVSHRLSRPDSLPEQAIPLGEPGEAGTLRAPPGVTLLTAASRHARDIFRRDAHSELAREWNLKNPVVTAVLVSAQGHYLGYFDVLPLTETAAEEMRSGKLAEEDIGSDLILSQREMGDAPALYLSGIAVKEAEVAEETHCRAAQLVGGLAPYIRHFYGGNPRSVLATAATRAGASLLQRPALGARVVCPGESRKDHHDLYEFIISDKLLEWTLAHSALRGPPPKTSFG